MNFRHLVAICIFAMLLLSACDQPFADQAETITVYPVILHGVRPTWLQINSDAAIVSPIVNLTITIVLYPQNTPLQRAIIHEQRDPNSPLYHRFLTPAEYTAQFAPSSAALQAIANYFSAFGLTIGNVSTNHLLMKISGPVTNIEQALQIHLNQYYIHGTSAYAPDADPTLPSTIAGYVQTIVGLDDVHATMASHIQFPHDLNHPRTGTGPINGFAPADISSAYNISPLTSAGYSGANQTIALAEFDGYTASDITQYLTQFHLPAIAIQNVLVDGATTTPGSGSDEVELDMEIAAGLAPQAKQMIYIAPNSGSGSIDLYNAIVSDNLAKVISTSWGLCEASTSSSQEQSLHSIFAQASLQGQTIYAAAGDSGAYDCGDASLGVDYPASDPYVVGVGGTTLSTTSNQSYAGESVWSCNICGTAPYGTGSGGGISSFFLSASYQTGPGVPVSSHRLVPDVAANADPDTGYAIYCTTSPCSVGGSNWLLVGGTSAAAPLWAAISADINQYLLAQGKSILGDPHAAFYRLFNTTQSYAAYHDITTGNNLHYNAATGYDLATGIGSPNAWNLAQDIIASSITTPTPTVTATATTTPTVTATATMTPTVTATMTITPTSTATVSPTFTASPTPGITQQPTTPGVYNPVTGTFFLKYTATGGVADLVTVFGPPNLTPFMGNWTGSATDSIGVYDPGTGTFFLKNAIGNGPADTTVQFGPPHWTPLVGDWTGSGRSSLGVYDPNTGTFFLKNTISDGPADTVVQFGSPHMIPLVGDWLGNGKDSIGIYNPQNGVFFLKNAPQAGTADTTAVFGPAVMTPIIGDWQGTGKDSIGIYASQTGVFYLKDIPGNGPADVTCTFGPPGFTPIVGAWK